MAEKKTDQGTAWKESEKGVGGSATPATGAGAAGEAKAKGRPTDDRAATENAAAPKGETGGGEDGA